MNDSPGLTGGCVMNGTPSMSFGSSRPWKWIAVDSGSLLLQHDAHAIAFAHADLRAGHLSVVRPRLDLLARRRFPLDLARGELEHLHASVEPRREQLVAASFGLRGERFDSGLVHRVHRGRHLRGRW